MRRSVFASALFTLIGCATARAPGVPEVTLPGTDGALHDVRAAAGHARATVLTFFSAHCPCQRAHDDRLRELYERYAPAGVAFLAIDSEADSSLAVDTGEARQRHFPFPIVSDKSGLFADAFDAEYATFSVVIDPSGRVLYRGGLDSDKNHLHADATPYLKNALDQWLSGRAPDPSEAKALGCSLRRR
jgi:peroxiredoxin